MKGRSKMPVMDKLSSEEIIKIAEKVKQNEKETHDFSESFRKYTNGELRESDILLLGETPYSLQISGAKALPLNITQLTLKNAMNPENVVMKHHTSGHDLDSDTIIKLPELLREPVLIIQDKDSKNLTAVLDAKDKQDRNIICRITLDKQESQYTVNRLSSMYGKRELADYLSRAFSENRVISMHKEKAGKLLHSIGCQSPKENTITSFDNSIAYSMANVKYPDIEISEKAQFHDGVQHEKLLPIFNAKAEFHENRLTALNSKRDTRMQKIAKNEAKIHKLTERAERFEDLNKALGLMEHIPAIKALIELNQKRIDKIKNNRIPNRESKIAYHKEKISEIDHKSKIISHKLERAVALSDTIKSFSIIGSDRKQRFANAMDSLNLSTLNCLKDKKDDILFKIDKNTMLYNSSLSSAEDKIDIQKSINKWNARITDIDKKIVKLSNRQLYVQKTDTQIEDSMKKTADIVNKTIDEGNISVAKLSEDLCLSDNDETIRSEINKQPTINVRGHFLAPEFENKTYTIAEFNQALAKANENWQHDDSKEGKSAKIKISIDPGNGEKYENSLPIEANFSKLSDFIKYNDTVGLYEKLSTIIEEAENYNDLANTEMALEENYNNIDGVINTVPKDKSNELTNEAKEALFEKGIKLCSFDNEHNDGDQMWYDRTEFSFNPEDQSIWLKEFSGYDGKTSIERCTADDVINQFEYADREAEKRRTYWEKYHETNDYSDYVPARRGYVINQELDSTIRKLLITNDLIGMKKHLSDNWLDTLIAEGKAEKLENGFLKINTAYYKSLPKQERHIEEFPKDKAEALMKKLSEKNIDFSAVSRRNGNIAITVSNNVLNELNENSVIKDVSKSEKSDIKKEIINPDYYKSLSRENRVVNTLSYEDGKNIIQKLEDNNIAFSAVKAQDYCKIAISRENEVAFNSVLHQNEVKYINPEYYKSLDKNDRFTQRMPEEQAKEVISELNNRGIEHSAVLKGNNSAITINQHDVKKTKDVRGFLKKQAQKIHEKPHNDDKSKSKDKGVDID